MNYKETAKEKRKKTVEKERKIDAMLFREKYREIGFEPTNENPNDIWCPKCESYKEKAIEDKSKKALPFDSILRCPTCKTEVRVS